MSTIVKTRVQVTERSLTILFLIAEAITSGGDDGGCSNEINGDNGSGS